MGMTESGRRGDSVYLRGWDDYEHHTLKLTAAKVAGMGHVAFRATSPEALQRRVAMIEASGSAGAGPTETSATARPTRSTRPTTTHGDLLRDRMVRAASELAPSLKNQAQRFPARGVNVRRLDHLNLLAADVAELRQFFEDVVGMRTTEMIVLDSGEEAGAWMTATNKSYDMAFTADHYGARGRFHHVTYAVDSREEVLRAADIFLEHGVHIETGPHKHAVQQTFFLYVYEPGGNRVEVANAGARLMLAPDWQPVVWTESRTQEGAGVGPQDDRELPHARDAADRPVRRSDGEAEGVEQKNSQELRRSGVM